MSESETNLKFLQALASEHMCSFSSYNTSGWYTVLII